MPAKADEKKIKREDLSRNVAPAQLSSSCSWQPSEWGFRLTTLVTFSVKCKGPAFSLTSSLGRWAPPCTGLCSLMLRFRAEPVPCPVSSVPNCLQFPKPESVPSTSPMKRLNFSAVYAPTRMLCVCPLWGCFCTAESPGLQTGL